MGAFRRIACIALAALMLSAAAAKQKPQPRGIDSALLSGEVKTEGDYRWALASNVSIYEMWHASDTIILSSIGSLIRYYEFDWEVAPRDGEWIVQGIILVGTGDGDTQPVGIKFWSKERTRLQAELSHKLSLESKEAIAIFTPSLVECTVAGDCGSHQFRFVTNQAGEVFVGTTKIGSIK